MTDPELNEVWSTTPGGIDIPVSATARGAELRNRAPLEWNKLCVGFDWREFYMPIISKEQK